MLPEAQKKVLLQDMKEKARKNPHQVLYGLYKDYSYCKGNIYKQQKNNIYLVLTSSDTYTRYLESIGYHKALLYKPSKLRYGKIMRLE